MLDTLFGTSIVEALTLGTTITILLSSLVIGLVISGVYIRTHKNEGYSGSFVITLIMLPAIIAMIILLVGNNVARAFSLAGAFSLIRFRSAPGEPKDIAYVFFTLAVGLACGMGYIAFAVVFAAIICVVMVILTITQYGMPKSTQMQLKIVLPENVNYQGLFDDLLETYTDGYQLTRVKTADFGTLFELVYHITLKNEVNQKEFMDQLRCRNGNLNITLGLRDSH